MSDEPEFSTDINQPMTDETAPETPVTVEQPTEQATETAAQLPRVFKTGATKIVEDDSMRGLSVAQVQQSLKATYPEVANATVRESTNADGQRVIEFLPQPGRKG